MTGRRARIYAYGALVLLVTVAVGVLWYTTTPSHSGVLRVTFLDVGQGDAVLIESPSGKHILVDGGKGSEVLRELGGVLRGMAPFDMVVATHPDSDHIGGLSEVMTRYGAPVVVGTAIEKESDATLALALATAAQSAQHRDARRGEVYVLGDGVVIETLFPDRDLRDVESNLSSVVLRVVYGEHSFLLTGDSPVAIEKYLVSTDGDALRSTVLKAGHHGSKTSTHQWFLNAVAPEYVVYSRGCDNRYGHPHQEVDERVRATGATVYDTCTHGRIIFVSDGTALKVTTER